MGVEVQVMFQMRLSMMECRPGLLVLGVRVEINQCVNSRMFEMQGVVGADVQKVRILPRPKF